MEVGREFRGNWAYLGHRVSVSAGIGAAALGLGFAVSQVSLSRDGLVLALLAATLVTPIVTRIVQRRFDPFEPIVIFAVAFGAMFLVRPLAMLAEGNFVYERSSRIISVSDTFSEMLVLAAAGAASFVGAYALPLGKRLGSSLRSPAVSFHSGRVLVGSLVATGAGLVLTGLFLAAEGVTLDLLFAGRSLRLTEAYRSSSAYLAHGPYLLAPSALMLFVVGRAHSRKGFVLLAAIIVVILLALSVPTGSRMLLLPFVGAAVVYHYLARKSRPGIVTLVALLVVSCFVSKLLLDTRAEGGSAGGTAVSTLRNPEQMLDPLTSDADAEMAPALAAALRVIPEEVDFMRGGATAGDFFRRPIPRELWSEKPLSPRETLIARLWPSEYLQGVANPEFSVLLYFYLDFALLGVIAGMALYGIIARFVYEHFRRHGDTLIVRLLFSFSVPFVAIALRDSPVDTFVRAAFIFLPVLLVFRFAARRSPETARV